MMLLIAIDWYLKRHSSTFLFEKSFRTGGMSQFDVAFSLTVGSKLIQFDIFVIIFPTNIWQPCTNIHIKLANLTRATHQFIAKFEKRKKFLVQKYMKIWRYIDCCSEMSQTGQIKVSGQGGRHLMYYPWESDFPLVYISCKYC